MGETWARQRPLSGLLARGLWVVHLSLWLGLGSAKKLISFNSKTVTGNVMKLSTKHISTKCATLRIPLIHQNLSLGLNSGV
jgi:hypothetical protein